MVLSGILVSGTCWLNAADEAPHSGLRGILPETVPVELTGAIAALPENWQAWGTGLTTELTALYETPDADVATQRLAITALRKRIETARKHAADPQYRSILNVLVSISGGLERRVDTAEAALDTLERGSEMRAEKVSAAKKRVAGEAKAVEAYLGKVRNGSGWVKYLMVGEVGAVVQASAEEGAASLATVQSRLKEKNSLADAKAREFLSRPQFASYEEAVDGYLSALAAPVAVANNPELRNGLKALLGALEEYESSHAGAAAAAARKAFDAVRPHAADGGEKLGLALRDNYFNYNLRVVASEAYLNKFIGQNRVESGPVRDFILGADVQGNQTTHTNVRVKLVPSGNTAQFDLIADGQVSAATFGYTSQATISTSGNHHFIAAKRIEFNGESFSTGPARISVSAHNTTTGADTNMGLFSGIANNIAMNRAEGMRGESEAIAAQRLRDRVTPQFNADVDKKFHDLNPEVAERLAALRELNLYPEAKSWSTTDSELKIATRMMAPTELGGSEPSPAMYLGRGVSVLLHDSLMNNYCDRLDLAGKSMTDDEIKAKIEGQLTTLLGREIKFKDDKPAATEESSIKTIVFDKNDPLRMHADDGMLVLTLRAGFKQEGKEDIPTQVITVPLKFTVTAQNIIVETANISIEAAEKAENPGTQLARAGVIRKKLDAAFPRREIERVHRIKQKEINAVTAVTRIRALDCWLSITYE
jgi:hypothetical protein